MNKKLSLEELHKKAYESIDKTDNFNYGEFEDIPDKKYEYEEYETFHNELIKKEEGKTQIEFNEYEIIDKILKNKDRYKNAKIAERLYQQTIKESRIK